MGKIFSTIKIMFAFVLLGTYAHSIEIKNLSVAVDVAGKQRMYTQRMLKDYAMIGMGNTFGNPKKDLKETMENFENHLHSLIKFNKDPKTKESLAKVEKLWSSVKPTLGAEPKKENAAKMQEDLEALLKQSNEAVGLFAKQTGKVSGEIIDISGRQRMLSQRMASLYMLKVWGIDDPQFKKKMDQAMKLYRDSLERLKASEMSNDEIQKYLASSEKAFKFLRL